MQFYHSIGKQQVYDTIWYHLPGSCERVLTFPGPAMTFEEELIQSRPNVEIIGLERSRNVYEKQRQKPITRSIDLRHTSDRNFFSTYKGGQFDLIWLDYCGFFSANKILALSDCFAGGFIRDGGLFGITLSVSRNFQYNDVFREQARNVFNLSMRMAVARPLLIQIRITEQAVREGYVPTLLSYFQYQGTADKPMVFMLYRFDRKSQSEEIIRRTSRDAGLAVFTEERMFAGLQ